MNADRGVYGFKELSRASRSAAERCVELLTRLLDDVTLSRIAVARARERTEITGMRFDPSRLITLVLR